jgi:flagellar protein FlgJ
MSTTPVNPSYYADFSGLSSLKRAAHDNNPQALRQVARQFESLLTNMLMKSMREAKLGDGLGDSQETEFYQEMFDQQLSLQLSQGKGLGLADMLVQQLARSGLTGATAPAKAAPAAPAVPVREQTAFVQQIAPYAERAAQRLGVAPDALIAHAALETGWGRHVPAGETGSSFNLFGIKATGRWSGASVTTPTVEYAAGVPSTVKQPFRSYASLEQGIDDYVNLLATSPRFRSALGTGHDVQAFAGGLARGGYATDPAYAPKLTATAEQVRALRAGSEPARLAAALPITAAGNIA